MNTKITFNWLEENKYSSVTDCCRDLILEDNYPETLEVFRGEMLCLTVDVKRAAKLMPTGRGFKEYSPFHTDSPYKRKVSSLMRFQGVGASRVA